MSWIVQRAGAGGDMNVKKDALGIASSLVIGVASTLGGLCDHGRPSTAPPGSPALQGRPRPC